MQTSQAPSSGRTKRRDMSLYSQFVGSCLAVVKTEYVRSCTDGFGPLFAGMVRYGRTSGLMMGGFHSNVSLPRGIWTIVQMQSNFLF